MLRKIPFIIPWILMLAALPQARGRKDSQFFVWLLSFGAPLVAIMHLGGFELAGEARRLRHHARALAEARRVKTAGAAREVKYEGIRLHGRVVAPSGQLVKAPTGPETGSWVRVTLFALKNGDRVPIFVRTFGEIVIQDDAGVFVPVPSDNLITIDTTIYERKRPFSPDLWGIGFPTEERLLDGLDYLVVTEALCPGDDVWIAGSITIHDEQDGGFSHYRMKVEKPPEFVSYDEKFLIKAATEADADARLIGLDRWYREMRRQRIVWGVFSLISASLIVYLAKYPPLKAAQSALKRPVPELVEQLRSPK